MENFLNKSKDPFANSCQNYDERKRKSLKLPKDFDMDIFYKYKCDIVEKYYASPPPPPKNILDFGCGVGMNIHFLRKIFPQSCFFGCDVSEESLKVARNKIQYAKFDCCINTSDLNALYKYKDIDLIFVSTVLHHIPFAEHKSWIDALFSILNSKSGEGKIIIFEHNLYNPVVWYTFYRNPTSDYLYYGAEGMLKPNYTKRLLTTAGFSNIKTTYTLFFLKRNKLTKTIENMLSWFPLGAQYYCMGEKL
jgi:SAM-dependent methyltransferase